MTNIYSFKVTIYGDKNSEIWYPPINARTYEKAIRKVYSNEYVESATLKIITQPDGKEHVGKALYNPTNYDLK